ncbi:MurR/RpiR family transcriptional regulator [Macrococcoides bohemicum]|uniref:MurR/RpiR family transcriptional regulator n=1 Tax=Macrococcoides bohemicum TaxID=1903056 RepID=UPI00165E6B68|nr:MurR/RpiR family transcriptional regulator [Macrococcus bohemicus]MBC9874934.1 MurR/RpiR family transcriptional regulator [Macrococcus bohemicus]QYA44477.1 MurR/RpiR family transcriptional regulator [Macrococcus bohemicus]
MYSVLGQITQMYDTFTPVEKRIADLMIDQPVKVVNLPIKEIAKMAGTSEAAIVRFSKRLGLSGIKVVKVELARELHTIDTEKKPSKIEFTDSVEVLKEKVFNNSIQALYNTEKILSPKLIDDAAQAIIKAKRMMIFGVGIAQVVGEDFRLKLAQIDKLAHIASDSFTAVSMLGNFEPGDVLFAITSSGRSKEIIEVIKYAKRQNVTIVLLTQKVPSPALRMADIALAMAKEENEIKVGTMTVRIVQLAIIDAVYLRIVSIQKEEVVKILTNVNNARKEIQDAQ